MKGSISIAISILIPLIIILIPREWIPIEGLTVIEHRVIAIFVMAAVFWILEPIPIFATSILVITLELVFLSDKGIRFLIKDGDPVFGELLSYKDIFATFASPIILLFIGGFFLAMAATKYRLDQNLARVLLKPFGTKPAFVMMGLMIITALFSMFMSNTATTAMMLSILVPVLGAFSENDPGRTGFALAIPFAANIGGMGTPIGTPPNAIALKYLTGDFYIGFGEWMTFGVPIVLILLIIAWVLLNKLFKPDTPALILNIKGKFLKTPKAILVYATFILTVLLWLTDFIHGMNSYVVAMIPVTIFLVSKIITKEDLKTMSWDVLWLVSGGIALGYAMGKSGLAVKIVDGIPFGDFSPLVIVGCACFLSLIMANFMSHTATANLLLPIMAALGTSLQSLTPYGGTMMIILAVTLASSLGMSLPISTPPNALAHATGFVQSSQMSRLGAIIGIIGLMLTFLLMTVLNQIGFFLKMS